MIFLASRSLLCYHSGVANESGAEDQEGATEANAEDDRQHVYEHVVFNDGPRRACRRHRVCGPELTEFPARTFRSDETEAGMSETAARFLFLS